MTKTIKLLTLIALLSTAVSAQVATNPFDDVKTTVTVKTSTATLAVTGTWLLSDIKFCHARDLASEQLECFKDRAGYTGYTIKLVK